MTVHTVTVAVADQPAVRTGHVYPVHILAQVVAQANSNPALYCTGNPGTPGTISLNDVCYRASNFRLCEQLLQCDFVPLWPQHTHVAPRYHYHIYGVGEVDSQNVITQYQLTGICAYSEPLYAHTA